MTHHHSLPPVKEALPWKWGLIKLLFNWRVVGLGILGGAYILNAGLSEGPIVERQRFLFRSAVPTRYVYDKQND